MLKYIGKTLLVAIIAGSLISFQTSVVYAGVTATKGETVTDEKGVTTSTKNYKFDKISDSDMLASLAMLAAGFLTGRKLTVYTPATMDVQIAGAAGAAYIAGEVLSNLKFKGTIDEMTVEIQKRSDAKINEEQIQRLEDLKKSYEEAKSTTKTKKMLQTASAVAFGVAAAMATYMAMNEEAIVGKCRLGFTTANAELKECIAKGAATAASVVLAKWGQECATCQTELVAYATKYNQYILRTLTIAKSTVVENSTKADEAFLVVPPKTCTASTAPEILRLNVQLKSSCTPSIVLKQNDSISGDPNRTVANIEFNNYYKNHLPVYAMVPFKNPNETILDIAFDLIFPSAQAGWLPLLGLGATTALAMAGMVKVAANEIDLMMFNPKNRAIAFAALGGVAMMSASSSDNIIGELEANIKKIDTILADLKKNVLGTKTQNISTQLATTSAIRTKMTEKDETSNNPKALTPCMNSDSSTNCKSITTQLGNTPGFGNLPDSFKNIATQASKLGDSLSGSNGISGSALSSAEGLAKNQAAVSNLLKDRQDALTKLTNGKAQPRKEGDQFLNKMKASVQRYLRDKGTTATGMMASIGATPISGADKANAEESAGKDSKPSIAANGDTGGAAEEAKKEGEGQGLNLDFSEAPAEGLVATNGAGQAAPEYDVTTNEIGKENGPSIFEVISSRYLKSGYPKLLDEEPTKN